MMPPCAIAAADPGRRRSHVKDDDDKERWPTYRPTNDARLPSRVLCAVTACPMRYWPDPYRQLIRSPQRLKRQAVYGGLHLILGEPLASSPD